MTAAPDSRTPRRGELLEAAYSYALEHGLADLSLRPLATAIGSSPRVVLYLFGTKEGLVRALLARAREDELLALTAGRSSDLVGLAAAVTEVWSWLREPERRPVLRLWAEAYVRSLVEPGGAWSDFAATTVGEWLDLLADLSGEPRGESGDDDNVGLGRRTLALAVLRGCLLDLLATNETDRVDAAVASYVALLAGQEARC